MHKFIGSISGSTVDRIQNTSMEIRTCKHIKQGRVVNHGHGRYQIHESRSLRLRNNCYQGEARFVQAPPLCVCRDVQDWGMQQKVSLDVEEATGKIKFAASLFIYLG